MALPDRILPLCDLLLGAAHADKLFKDREREAVRGMLADLTGAGLTQELEDRIARFDPARFDLAATAAEFRRDPMDDRRRVLNLVAAVHEADGELDLAEDDYLRALAAALDMPPSALEGMTLDVEVEELRDDLAKVRRVPPPPPPKKGTGSVDVDLD
jgi:uncharacterized tellurite resistance protein B-like protein